MIKAKKIRSFRAWMLLLVFLQLLLVKTFHQHHFVGQASDHTDHTEIGKQLDDRHATADCLICHFLIPAADQPTPILLTHYDHAVIVKHFTWHPRQVKTIVFHRSLRAPPVA